MNGMRTTITSSFINLPALHAEASNHLVSRNLLTVLRAFSALTLGRASGWLGSRVVGLLDSGAEGPGFKSQPRRCRLTVFRQTVHTHCASVHQAAKLVAALLRVVGVTAGLADSNGSLSPGL